MEFKCVSTKPEDLKDGRVVGIGDAVTLTPEQYEDLDFQEKLAQRRFIGTSRASEKVANSAIDKGVDAIGDEKLQAAFDAVNTVEIDGDTVEVSTTTEDLENGGES